MSTRTFILTGLVLAISTLACSTTDRTPGITMPTTVGEGSESPIDRCPLHSSHVKITIVDTEAGACIEFVATEGDRVPWLQATVPMLIPDDREEAGRVLSSNGTLATLSHHIADGNGDRGGGDAGAGHDVIPLDQLPPVHITGEKTDTGACILFVPKDPARLEELRACVRCVMKALCDGPCSC